MRRRPNLERRQKGLDLIIVPFDRAVVFGVQLRRFFSMLIGVRGVTRSDVRVMASALNIAAFVVCSSFAVMSGGLLVVACRVGMVFMGSVSGRHH